MWEDKVMEQETTANVTFSVTGMTCDGCASGLERALSRVPGVQRASVSFQAGTPPVDHDPSRTTPGALTAAVIDAGFDVLPSAPLAGAGQE